MNKLEEGNVYTKSNGERGWILGNFIDPSSPFHNEDFEIKWSKIPMGERKEDAKANKTAKTLCLLVYGKFSVILPEEKRTAVLKEEGDYIFFSPGVVHSWEALETSLIITVRWPSLKGDQ